MEVVKHISEQPAAARNVALHPVGDDGGIGLHALDCAEPPRVGVALPAAMVAVSE